MEVLRVGLEELADVLEKERARYLHDGVDFGGSRLV